MDGRRHRARDRRRWGRCGGPGVGARRRSGWVGQRRRQGRQFGRGQLPAAGVRAGPGIHRDPVFGRLGHRRRGRLGGLAPGTSPWRWRRHRGGTAPARRRVGCLADGQRLGAGGTVGLWRVSARRRGLVEAAALALVDGGGLRRVGARGPVGPRRFVEAERAVRPVCWRGLVEAARAVGRVRGRGLVEAVCAVGTDRVVRPARGRRVSGSGDRTAGRSRRARGGGFRWCGGGIGLSGWCGGGIGLSGDGRITVRPRARGVPVGRPVRPRLRLRHPAISSRADPRLVPVRHARGADHRASDGAGG
ncbi:hypothetical protein SAMN05444858_12213 [Micromonospora avicenniae]|uniref:Uncharacterized protein n=1 Tax=Micromonospora avicenniae TaxID=1198245 RepID=A0A1N7EAJ6_9ACTN|nr:hypothetical protein SAMN05444858_12213 [Micromonospora avicenniae]